MDLVVTEWKRYGHHRSYVKRGEDSLGYLDHKTGDVLVEQETERQAVLEALGMAPARVEPAPYAITIERLATDLGGNRAGAGARERAAELRGQSPVRTLLSRVRGEHTDERAWRVGAQGEKWAGEELDKLTKRGWTVVHDVPVGERGANIDHVLVGPGGVFTVNSKYHVGKQVSCNGTSLRVGGYATKHLHVARHEAQRASRLMSSAYGEPVHVTALIVVLVERDNFTRTTQPADGQVLVLRAREARTMLEQLPVRYAVHEVDRLALWARRDTTWS